MPKLRTNILANYAGQIWMAVVSVAFVPLYVRQLGMEAFGLIGLMLSIQAFSTLLDLGMGGVVNRELARRSHDVALLQTTKDLVRTFEWLVWPIALAVALAIWLSSAPLANHWLHPEHLSSTETAHAIAVMGLAIALQWPSSFYANGLSGLEKQTALNLINASFATLRGAGVLAVLYWLSSTVAAFMWWYAIVGALQSVTSAIILWRYLPKYTGRGPNFRLEEVRSAGRFAGGLLAIAALSVAVTQLDRMTLSALRPLAELGYFSLALSIAAGMGRMIQPLFNALYPRYSALLSRDEPALLKQLYHESNQCVAVIASSISAVLILYSEDVVYLWTGDSAVAPKIASTLSILIAGTALNGVMNLPYALQLAHGWTRLTVRANLIALILGIPFCIWAVQSYGTVGAACLWFAINLGFFVLQVPMMHRVIMRGEMAAWYFKDILPPFIASFMTGILTRLIFPKISRDFAGFLDLVIISSSVLASAAISSPFIRKNMKQLLGNILDKEF